MPRKSKVKTEWNLCSKCQLLIHNSELTQHEKQCGKGLVLSHGFITNGVLHATVSHVSVKDLPEVPTAIKGDVIYLHPRTMVLCNIFLGHPCVVDRSHIFHAWSSSKLHPSSVAFPPSVSATVSLQAVLEGRLVTVKQFRGDPLMAQQVEIQLQTVHQAFTKDDFIHFLPHKLESKYIKEGSMYTIFYFGLKCTFCVKSIQTVPLTRCHVTSLQPCVRHGEELDLSQSFSELNMSSVSDAGDNTDISFTDARDISGRSMPDSVSDTSHLVGDELESASFTAAELTSHQQSTRSLADSNGNSCVSSPASDFPVEQQVAVDAVNNNAFQQFVQVTAETKFVIVQSDTENTGTSHSKVTFDSLGGLDKQIRTIKELFDLHLNRPELGQSYGLTFSRGILLYGPSGTGKTAVAEAVANEMPVYTVTISVTDVLSKYVGETEKKLRALFQTASERSPSLIIIDNLDGLCPRRDESSSDLEKRVVATFLTLLDGLAAKESGSVCLVLGITNKPDKIDPALRRPGRLDCDVETGVPTAEERLQILKKLLQPIPHSMSDVTLKDISDARHGFVGADLALLVRKAAENAVKRCPQGECPFVTAEDMLNALDSVSPSAVKEVMLEIPQVRWSDIGGQAEVKLKLRQAVEWQLKYPEVFTRFGISPPRGILMYGPPGCSKTMVAKALATESGLNFLAVKGPECFSKWVGESERAVREVFCKARAAAPSIVFFDEIDALAVERGSGGSNVADRVLTQLLTEMDGVERLSGVCVVAATNRPDKIDQALLRPGRFDQILYVPLPDADTRREILQIEFRKKPVAADVAIEELVSRTERYSGAELTAVCNEAALAALQEDIHSKEIRRHHFELALSSVKPVTSPERVKFYEDYSRRKQSGLRFV